MKTSENYRKMMQVVTLYYEQQLTQSEIGKKLQMSRPVVSKLLQQAKELGVVSVSIKDKTASTIALELQIQAKYGLKEVRIAGTTVQNSQEATQQAVSQLAASYVSEQLRPGMRLGLSWGTTLAEFVEAVPFQSWPTITVCALVGGVANQHLYFDTNHLVFQLAQKLQGHCHYFYGPALAETVSFAKTLSNSQWLGEAIATAKSVDLAIVGVGNPQANSTWKTLGYLTAEESASIQTSEIAGDAVASLFDKKGQTVNNNISQRMLGIKVEDLSEIPEVIVLGCGSEKIASIRGLLAGKRCTTLIVDQTIAEALLL